LRVGFLPTPSWFDATLSVPHRTQFIFILFAGQYIGYAPPVLSKSW
jgi:hypothetical protein